jgi:hypothetical protein
MRTIIRIPRPLYTSIKEDLACTHEFATERVGFLSAKIGKSDGERMLILARRYYPVADEHYVPDPHSGARINTTAIREVLEQILDTPECTFHVHMHNHRGKPAFGKMDCEEIPRLVASFRAVAGSLPHGMLVFSEDSAEAWVWMPGSSDFIQPSRITIVGYPLELITS